MRADTNALRLIVVWEYVTAEDREMGTPTAAVLGTFQDRRAMQFWDGGRLLSDVMARDLPRDTLPSVAEIDTNVTLVWDCLSLYAPRVRWGARYPVPTWAGRPTSTVLDTFRRRLAAMESAPAPDSAR